MESEIYRQHLAVYLGVQYVYHSTQSTVLQPTPRTHFFIEQLLTDCQSKTIEEVMQ